MDETKPATQVFPETRAIVTSDGDVLWVVPESKVVWVTPESGDPCVLSMSQKL